MKILFIGDIFGATGREALKQLLPSVIEEENPDIVIANCENAAAGAGISKKIYKELMNLGIDFLTSGNHIWRRPEVYSLMKDNSLRLLRPANYPQGAPGKGWEITRTKTGKKIGIINLIGRINLLNLDCPFRCADRAVKELSQQVNCIFVDFHAETTSEKLAMGWYLDGRVSAVIGSHTHVPTADGRILPKGTAYLSDVGMTGAMDSVLGLEQEKIIQHFLSGLPIRFERATANPGMDMVIVELDDEGRGIDVRRARRFVSL